jgi:thiol-disulfide isomerase/thioredoxin
MKSRTLFAILAASCTLFCRPCPAAEATPAPAGAAQELQQLVGRIKEKIKQGSDTESDLASELQEFDALLARHRAEKTDDVARILVMKAMLYAQALDNPAKGAELVRQLKQDFPETKLGKDADRMLEMLAKQEEAMKAQAALAVGARFPDFAEKDLAGSPLTLSAYKGKIVLIDFWATWCGPCVGELPNVIAAYQKYHAQGFEIIGISLDQDQGKLTSFLKDKGMTWAQYFDGKGWQNKLAAQYGIQSIPATFLLDGEGVIIAKNLRGDKLEQALAKRLGAK